MSGVTVVDASVAAKWLLAEPDSDQALAVLAGEGRLFAPSLIRTEVAGAVLRRHRNDQLDATKTLAALAAWGRLLSGGLLSLVPDEDVLDRAAAIALRVRHPLADCLYLAVARSMNAKLLTADATLRERGSSEARVMLLAARRDTRG